MSHQQQRDRLVNLKVACDRLSVSRATLYRMFDRGELQPVKIGGSTRVRESDLQRLIGGTA